MGAGCSPMMAGGRSAKWARLPEYGHLAYPVLAARELRPDMTMVLQRCRSFTKLSVVAAPGYDFLIFQNIFMEEIPGLTPSRI